MAKRLDEIKEKAEKANQAFWDEIAPVHYKSYDIEKLKQGKSLVVFSQIQRDDSLNLYLKS